MIWLILILFLILFVFVKRKFKTINCGDLTLITGGVKTGKTTLAVYKSVKDYKKIRNRVLVFNFFVKLFYRLHFIKKPHYKEVPLYYSNIPVAVKGYAKLTPEIIERKNRPRYGSVIYYCESSLLADSMTFKDPVLNENMMLFNKLIAHETCGGKLFYDTQAVGDNHFAVKRCLSTVLYVHHSLKIPFFHLMWVRELIYSDDNQSVNAFNTDVDNDLKLVIVPKSYWKLFDYRCFSALTDDLPVSAVEMTIKKKDKKKVRKILSFKNFITVPKELTENEKES